ncbi:hypothetical protein BCV69DRAFT_282829 [Microstroma glucosiphilum]|uniref:Polynucleotide 5'-hydroxyl-kinase GRC3 n=1 Tax=Pseudomicrostroma glucosiphilum TaxID=1684307 RepID=A0A316U5X4_9BASI|nr:hypothetical protein BCV69DRAFT_282829 [Pseudomicrostroma glucosiphilum]PWN20612.1 hypothetical protein BCV69DRAFT_282829 [Pseudomicrostroma glucosiphilum]
MDQDPGPRSQNIAEKYDWFSPVWRGEERDELVNAVHLNKASNGASIKGKERMEQDSTIVLGLRAGQTFSLQGLAEIRLLAGSVRIDGVSLSSKQVTGAQTLACPKSSPLPIISAEPSPAESSLAATGSRRADEQDQALLAASSLSPTRFDCIISLSPILDSGLDALSRICPLAGPDPFCSIVSQAGSSTPSAKAQSTSTLQLAPDPTLPFLSLVFQSRVENGSYQFHRTPASWVDALNAAPRRTHGEQQPQVFMVKGPKGAGKSSLARRLVNALRFSQVRKDADDDSSDEVGCDVAFMDLDLGQGEFGVPGSIGLHLLSEARAAGAGCPLLAPAWLTHASSSQHKTLLSHYLGQTTPRDIPSLYLSAVQSLSDYYRSHLASESGQARRPTVRPVNLIVNTMGWTKGLGAELAARVESIVRPDVIYDLTTTLERSGPYRQPNGSGSAELSEVTLPPAGTGQPYLDAFGAFVAPGPRIVPLQAIGLDLKLQEEAGIGGMVASWPTRRLTPADQRSLSIMTALHSAPRPSPSLFPAWDFSSSLLEQRPYVLDIRAGLTGGIQFFPPLARPVDVGTALAALNGELVGLAVVRDGSANEPAEGQNEQGHLPTSDDDMSMASSWRTLLSPVPVPFPALNFLSLALIRSIDPARGQIHLLCPYPVSSLLPASSSAPSLKLALIKSSGEAGSGSSGSVELPVWASLDAPAILAARSGRLGVDALGASNGEVEEVAGVRLEEVPYLEWPLIIEGASGAVDSDLEGRVIGKERRRVRRNLMRKNQS